MSSLSSPYPLDRVAEPMCPRGHMGWADHFSARRSSGRGSEDSGNQRSLEGGLGMVLRRVPPSWSWNSFLIDMTEGDSLNHICTMPRTPPKISLHMGVPDSGTTPLYLCPYGLRIAGEAPDPTPGTRRRSRDSFVSHCFSGSRRCSSGTVLLYVRD